MKAYELAKALLKGPNVEVCINEHIDGISYEFRRIQYLVPGVDDDNNACIVLDTDWLETGKRKYEFYWDDDALRICKLLPGFQRGEVVKEWPRDEDGDIPDESYYEMIDELERLNDNWRNVE
jgi:hypothetical protein